MQQVRVDRGAQFGKYSTRRCWGVKY